MTNSILGVIPGLQATAVMGQSLKMANYNLKKGRSQKAMTKNMIRGSVGIMAGVGLMKPTSEMINSY